MKHTIEKVKAVPKRIPIRQSDWDRFRHAKHWFFVIVKNEKLRSPLSLDIGSGGRPFPYGDVLCDLNLWPTPQRDMRELETRGKPFVVCDAQFLPFKTQAFDFATCLYLFEHVDDPGKIYSEMRRVSRHGYVQNPSWFNEEIMYGEPVHKWVMIIRGGRLYCRRVWKSLRPIFPIDYVFQRLYRRFFLWRLIHTILDESLNLFTTRYYY